jgi:DNA-binding XRE family transcriptional regulator
MSAHMRMHHTKSDNAVIRIRHAGIVYVFPKKIANQYRLSSSPEAVSTDEVFSEINKKHTKPGALLRGIRVRENLTQSDMAKKIRVTQSDISQMENGTRSIGRIIAKRIEKIFCVNYRSFLE